MRSMKVEDPSTMKFTKLLQGVAPFVWCHITWRKEKQFKTWGVFFLVSY